ncbi:MAG TPA: DUF5666 domain-containing protein [Chloroflexota bacterium]|nr:DUF5666 domain-containing protein [Chloroflexota bacterium]
MSLSARRPRRALLAALLTSGLVAAGLGLARAQGEVRIVSGPVVQLDGSRATVAANTGPVIVQLTDNTRYEKQGPGTLADLQPNQYVAVTGRPTDDGQVALLIRVFPAAQATVPARLNSPMEGPNAGNLMNNAIIESLANGRLTVRAGGESISIDTTPDTQVVHPVPASASDVTEGSRIAATGTMDADGVLTAAVVNLLDPPGGAPVGNAPPAAR